jgi:hypothetical protein
MEASLAARPPCGAKRRLCSGQTAHAALEYRDFRHGSFSSVGGVWQIWGSVPSSATGAGGKPLPMLLDFTADGGNTPYVSILLRLSGGPNDRCVWNPRVRYDTSRFRGSVFFPEMIARTRHGDISDAGVAVACHVSRHEIGGGSNDARAFTRCMFNEQDDLCPIVAEWNRACERDG